MIEEFINAIQQRLAAMFGGAFHWLADWLFLLEWYGWLTIILVLCLLIGYFAQFKWVRAILGLILLVAGAFVAGGTAMFRHMRGERSKDTGA